MSLIISNPTGSDSLQIANYISVNEARLVPMITQVGNILETNVSTENEWYRNDTLIPNTTNIDTMPADISFRQCYSITVSNGTGYNATSDSVCFSPTSTTEIYNVVTGGLNIYPNPAKNDLHVEYELTGTAETQLFIINMLGDAVYHTEPMQETEAIAKTINIKMLASGIYMLQLKVNGETQVIKFSIE